MSNPASLQIADVLLDILRRGGADRYGGEQVSQLEHALQTALQAEQEGAGPALVAAGLLHDIGHLVGDGDEGAAEQGIDLGHEHVAGSYLERWFGPEVTAPILMHVPAKRYFCAVEPGYHDGLSWASKLSLTVQGGPFTTDEAAAFARQPFATEAMRLRRWDEAAKVPGLETPTLAHYRPILASVLRP